MSEIIWEWANPDKGYERIEDTRIEGFYKEWLLSGEETGIVYHCFGDGCSTGIMFGEMTTYCLSAHQCDIKSHNKFDIRRTHKANLHMVNEGCNLL